MACWFGSGLPRSVTPERVRKILGFARSQEKEFRGILDAASFPAWMRTDPAWSGTDGPDEFYSRLRNLLGNAQGRTEFNSAREQFEGKPKRSRRADFFLRLIWDGVRDAEAKGIPVFQTVQHSNPDEPEKIATSLAAVGAWQLLAEQIWARGITSGDSENFLATVDQYPDLRPFLSDVIAGLVPIVDNIFAADGNEKPEPGGNRGMDVGAVLLAMEDIQGENLTKGDVDNLTAAIRRLTEVVETRRIELEKSSRIFGKWLDSHSESTEKFPDLSRRVASINVRIKAGGVDIRELEEYIFLLNNAIVFEGEICGARAQVKEAVGEEKYEVARDLLEKEKSLSAQRNAIYGEIDGLLGDTPAFSSSTEAVEESALDEQSGIRSKTSTAERGADADPVANTELVTHTEKLAEPRKDERICEPQAAGNSALLSDVSPTGDAPTSLNGNGQAPIDTEQLAVTSPGDASACSPATAEDGADDRELGEDASVADDNRPANDDQEDIDARLETVIVKAVARRRFGLAYHLALANPRLWPGANVVELVASNFAVDEDELITRSLPALVEAVRKEIERLTEMRPDHAALTASAALVPGLSALTGPPVAQLLSTLGSRLACMPSLQSLVRVSAEVSKIGLDMSPETLRLRDSNSHWREAVDELRRETAHWLESERNAKTPFQAATHVWRRMLTVWPAGRRSGSRRGSIGEMLSLPLQFPDKTEAGLVDEIDGMASHWRNDQGDGEIDRVDRELRKAATHPIVGKARVMIRDRIAEAVSLADRWTRLIRNRPEGRPRFDVEQAKRLREAARNHLPLALTEVNALNSPLSDCIRELIERHGRMFVDDPQLIPSPSFRLADLLNGDLLVDPEISFGEDGTPTEPPLTTRRLLNLGEDDDQDFEAAAIARAERWDFRGAEAAVEFGWKSGVITNPDPVRASIDMERVRAKARFDHEAVRVNNRLDAAYAGGLLPIETFETLRDRMPPESLLDRDELQRWWGVLREIEGEIIAEHEKTAATYRSRLNDLEGVSSKDSNRILESIDRMRFSVAEEYLDKIENNGMIEEIEIASDRPFDRFFPGFVEGYSQFREAHPDIAERLGLVTRAIDKRTIIGIIDASTLSDDAARDGGEFLNLWKVLRGGPTNRIPMTKRLGRLAAALGFESVRVDRQAPGTTGQDVEEYFMRCLPISDRRIIKLPDFGSRAAGNYRLLVVRGRVTAGAVLRLVRKNIGDRNYPVIVCFLGVLDAESRRQIAREMGSGGYRPTLVLDEALATFISLQAGERLHMFVDCALPFSFSAPYDPDAVSVPPEMFFGRRDERDKIINTDGDVAHFVYGGRRLGKTALLAHIAREHEPLAPDQLVLRINLKGSGIGEAEPADKLWEALAAELSSRGVIGTRIVRDRSITVSINHWLNERAVRRILLLVDEADAFLEADRTRGHRVLEGLKRLMEDSERRFKVIFSGLHDVQRASNDPNTPLAHLGDAIRIGPMLPERGSREAENLIREPLEALGYRFQSFDSIIRIAAETNYYPALIQQFCKELLRYLRANAGAEGPPWTISLDTVDRVFDARETRDRIRNMFRWTVQLDPRYELLTYLIARRSFDDETVQPRGVSITDIRDSALREWQRGFRADPSYSMFEVLLHEMQGLGILRETTVGEGDARVRGYAIRSRNLRMLIGNDDEIERRLDDARRIPASPRFDAAQFRRTLDPTTPSSLTAGQYQRLLGGEKIVGFVFGTRLGGLDRVRESLIGDGEVPGQNVRTRLHEAAVADAKAALSGAARSRSPGIEIVLLDMRGAWNPGVVEEVTAFVAKQDAMIRIVRPVFLCGPSEAWKWLDRGSRFITTPGTTIYDVWLEPCSWDFGRRWLLDREAGASRDLENVERPSDPAWPVVLAAAAGNLQRSMSAAIDVVASNDGIFSDIVHNEFAEAAFRTMCEWRDPLSADELTELLDGDVRFAGNGLHNAQRFLDWADRLGLVRMDERNGAGSHGYRLDTTCAAGVGRVLEG